MVHSKNALPSPPMHQQTMTREQQKYCGAIMRNLKRHRDAAAFLKPVDYVKLNVPDYPTIVKHPMDLCLVDKKLNNSEYNTVEEFVADVRLVFNNCFKYNGPEAMISVLCQNVESAFEKSLRQMPPSATTFEAMNKELSPPLSQHSSPPPSFATEEKRPKREIHCPSKDYPETYTTQRKMSHANKSIEMKYCFTTLREMKKNKYRNQIYPFLKPVDPVALNLPDYLTIVKQPMDLETIENKLMQDEYKEPTQFEADVLLMFNNCYLYNPPQLPIYTMAQEMETIFKEKWAARPIEEKKSAKRAPGLKRRVSSSQQDEENGSNSDQKLKKLEEYIKNLSQEIESIKKKKVTKKATPPPAQPPKKKGRPLGALNKNKRKSSAVDSDEEVYEFTFEEKKQLSEDINNLSTDQLEHVVAIIQNSMPNLGKNGQEEIELDIDSLNASTLRQLYHFVHPEVKLLKRQKSNALKNKRTHYSEKDSDVMIHQLEQQLKKFEGTSTPQRSSYDSSDSSSSESDDEGSSGSSGSDSD